MTINDLKILGAQKVRSNSNLMQTYIKLFKETFGYEPNCAGCTFNNDWNRLINLSDPQIIQIMGNTDFKLIDNNEIYSYNYKHENGRVLTARSYGNTMTQEFAEAYLKNGTKEQIEKRKNEFKELPKGFKSKDSNVSKDDSKDLSKLTYKELQKLAEQKGYKGKSTKKDDLLIYLESQV